MFWVTSPRLVVTGGLFWAWTLYLVSLTHSVKVFFFRGKKIGPLWLVRSQVRWFSDWQACAYTRTRAVCSISFSSPISVCVCANIDSGLFVCIAETPDR